MNCIIFLLVLIVAKLYGIDLWQEFIEFVLLVFKLSWWLIGLPFRVAWRLLRASRAVSEILWRETPILVVIGVAVFGCWLGSFLPGPVLAIGALVLVGFWLRWLQPE
jgi:hypothetical protein